MKNIEALVSENLWLSILLVVLVVVYIVFEFMQVKRRKNGVSAQEAVRLLNREKAIFLDVRDGKAYNEGHIVDAISTNIESLKESTKFLQKYKERPVIVYCDLGNRSKIALDLLKQAGFQKAFNLQGGLKAWKDEKLPLKKKQQAKDKITNKEKN